MIDDYLSNVLVVVVVVHPENYLPKSALFDEQKLTPTARSVNDIDILRLSCKSLYIVNRKSVSSFFVYQTTYRSCDASSTSGFVSSFFMICANRL